MDQPIRQPPIEILPLKPFTREEALSIASGYETLEQYVVSKTESDGETVFRIRLVQLQQPFRANFADDFNEEDFQRYLNLAGQGHSFGAYAGGILVGFAIGEPQDWNKSVRIWEFQVTEAYRGRGVGRALMQRCLAQARQDGFRRVVLETQNTNVKAVRFYRKMGFTLDSVDLSLYYGIKGCEGMVAFFMSQVLA